MKLGQRRYAGISATAVVFCSDSAERFQVSVSSTLCDGSNGCSTNLCDGLSASFCGGSKELSNCFSQHSQKQRANSSKRRYYQLFHFMSP